MDKVNSSNSYLPEQKSYAKTSDNKVVNSIKTGQELAAVSNLNPKRSFEITRGKADCKATKPAASSSTSYGIAETTSPAGQGLTNKKEKVNSSLRGRSNARTASSKVRLAANFMFPPHEKR